MSRPSSPFKQSFEQNILIKMPTTKPADDDPELGLGDGPSSPASNGSGSSSPPFAANGGGSSEDSNSGRPLVSPTNSGRPTSAPRRRKQARGGMRAGIINGATKLAGAVKQKGHFEQPEVPSTCPSDRVHYILGEENDVEGHESHPLFSEMAELYFNNEELEWRETARWIKFEEDVEEGGNRWSKPHVGTVSLHSLFELRSCILNGTVMLDLEATSLDQIADNVLGEMASIKQLPGDLIGKVKEALLRRHRHQHERRHDRTDSKNRLPIIRSLADIRNSSKSMFGSHKSLDKLSHDVSHSPAMITSIQNPSSPNATTGTTTTLLPSSTPSPTPVTATSSTSSITTTSTSIVNKSASCTAVTHPQLFHGQNKLDIPGSRSANSDASMPQSPSSTSLQAHILTGSDPSALTSGASSTDLQLKLNQAFMRKIPHGSEADNILVGEVDFLENPISAFVRLKNACHLGDLTEVPVPTRFLFILLGPHSIAGRYHEVGRAMATLMSDEVFHDVAYKAKNRPDLLSGVDEFLDAVTILPPGAWDPAIRIEPPTMIPSQESRKKIDAEVKSIDSEEEEEKEREACGLKRTGKLFGGLRNDIKRKLPWYWSDFKDAFVLQSIASVFFLYFACLTPIITFGGLLGAATGDNIATMESLMSGALCGIVYGFFAGQPLTILGSTGPVLVFETILYDFCKTYDFHYLNLRLYIGIWMTIILMILVATDMSAMVCFITRFTEENFATLISVIFIFKAIENILQIGKDFSVDSAPDSMKNYLCNCNQSNGQAYMIQEFSRNNTARQSCLATGGQLFGEGCDTPNYAPNIFYLSCLLFIMTYLISITLKDFKTAPFFPAKVRAVISDFAVVIAIGSMTLLDLWVHIDTPKLRVPTEFKPTLSDRGWIVPFFHEKNPIWLIPLAIIPALFSTILIFMDQQITAVIINRKEYRLKKGCGYHLDLFVLCILIGLCSFMGLPWFVAATVLAMTHVNSLKIESESAAPGEKPQFIGVREQRVTQIMIFVLVGLSVFFTGILQHIPMPVLYGVFLYMGTSSLKGSQFFERILIIFMPQKYQPDYIFLRHVPTHKVHLFTFIQVTCFALLWIVKSYKAISITFPLMLVVIILVRKLLDFFFTQKELKILDDIMPESTKRKREEEKELFKKEAESDISSPGPNTGGLVPNTSSGNMSIPLANGTVLKIPVDQVNISEAIQKSDAWRNVNTGRNGKNKSSNNPLKTTNGNKKKRNYKKDAKNEEEQKRLSTMREEDDEDDCGITIKIEAPTPIPGALSGPQSPKNGETPV